ncbi:hypothetical protein STEG23_004203, partial [Scotinomys teguina]
PETWYQTSVQRLHLRIKKFKENPLLLQPLNKNEPLIYQSRHFFDLLFACGGCSSGKTLAFPNSDAAVEAVAAAAVAVAAAAVTAAAAVPRPETHPPAHRSRLPLPL